MMESNLVILNYNPNGLWWGSEGGKKADGKKGRIDLELPFIESKFGKIDIICVQETHLNKDSMTGIPRTLHGFEWMHEPTRDGDKFAGVSIGYRHWMPKPENLMECIWSDESTYKQKFKNIGFLRGRLQMVGFMIQEKSILVANFYGYATENKTKEETKETKETQAYELINMARQICISLAEKWVEDHKLSTENVMMLLTGDFNATPWSIKKRNWEIDPVGDMPTKHKSSTMNKSRAMDAIEENFKHAKDVYEDGKPNDPYITNVAYEGSVIAHKQGIDHMYLLNESGKNRWWKPKAIFWNGKKETHEPISRHDLLVLKLEKVWNCAINRDAKGVNSPYKKIPDWIYENDEAMEGIAEIAMRAWRRIEHDDKQVLHTVDKLMVEHIPNFLKRFKKEKIRYVSSIKHSKKEDVITKRNELEKQMKQKQTELKKFDDGCVAGVLENNTVYTEKKTMKTKVHTLFKEKFMGNETRQRGKQQTEQEEEWLKYAPEPMSPKTAKEMEECLTMSNMEKAIKGMKKEAAPGIDGQSLALYMHAKTKEVMIKILLKVANYAIKHGRLPKCMSCSVIRLFQKEGKSNVDIKAGKRPVTLMVISIRIIAKVVAESMKDQMQKWIAEEQRAYVKGRRIEINTASIAILIQKCIDNDEKSEEYIEELDRLIRIETDFASAFDTISHGFLKKLLKRIGMGQRMVSLIMLMVNAMTARVIVNDDLTDEFRILIGVPQGCSLSGLLFILVLECLFRKAKTQPGEYGSGVQMIKRSKEKTLYNAFADDCDFFVTELTHVINWFTLMGSFEGATGLALQKTKCKANVLGKKYAPETQEGKKLLEYVKSKLPIQVGYRTDIKSVGITLSPEEYLKTGNITRKTWETKIKRVQPYAAVMADKMKGLNLITKARRINEVLSRVWYIVMNCIPEEKDIKRVDGMITQLMWNTTSYPVPKEMYIRTRKEPGGLGAPDAEMRVDAITTMWAIMCLKGKLPKSIEEYMQEVCKEVAKELTKTDMVIDEDSWWTGLNKIAQWRRKHTPGSKETKLKIGRKAYAPMVRAILLITELMAQEACDQETVETWTVKKIYDKRMSLKKNKKMMTPTGVYHEPVLNGQEKWTKEHNIEGWDEIWKLSERCIEAKEEDLHDALYKFIARRMIVPTGKKTESNSGYNKCQNCKTEDWTMKHAIINCEDVQQAWRESMNQHEVTAKDILQLEKHNMQEDRGTYNQKRNLSVKEVKVLSTMKEVVDEVEKRKDCVKKKEIWKVMGREEWRKKIESRMEIVLKRLERKNTPLSNGKRGGIG